MFQHKELQSRRRLENILLSRYSRLYRRKDTIDVFIIPIRKRLNLQVCVWLIYLLYVSDFSERHPGKGKTGIIIAPVNWKWYTDMLPEYESRWEETFKKKRTKRTQEYIGKIVVQLDGGIIWFRY